VIINPGTGMAGGGTTANSVTLIHEFVHHLKVFPIYVERYWHVMPGDRPKILEGYYDFRVSHWKEIAMPSVLLMIPGVEPEKVICGDDYNPFTVCRLYVDGSSYFWPGALHVVRETLQRMKEECSDENRQGQ